MQPFKASRPGVVAGTSHQTPTDPPRDLAGARHHGGRRPKELDKLKKDLEEEMLKVVEENYKRLEATLEAQRKENEKHVKKLKEKITETQESHAKKLQRIIKKQMDKNRKQVTKLQDKLDKTVKENEETMKNLWEAQTTINTERVEKLINEHRAKEVVLMAQHKAARKKAGGEMV